MRDFYEVTCACQPFHDHSKVRPPAAQQQTSDNGLLTSLDKKYMKNNRPISNLPFLSKILENVVLQRLLSHPQANSPYILFQSAYRAGHSTETVLLRVVNDILHMPVVRDVLMMLLMVGKSMSRLSYRNVVGMGSSSQNFGGVLFVIFNTKSLLTKGK